MSLSSLSPRERCLLSLFVLLVLAAVVGPAVPSSGLGAPSSGLDAPLSGRDA